MLTSKEQAFCRHYLATGGQGEEAAGWRAIAERHLNRRRAGYWPGQIYSLP